MDRRILLEYYLNKYVVSQYNMLQRIDVVSINDKEERIDVDLLVIMDSDTFKSKFDLTESLQEIFIYDNKISQTFLLAPIFKESKEINFDNIKKDIKHYIKIIINKRINLFKMDLKLEKAHSNNY
jgi:Pyruvate/2-oxoacid:ferredoxin oxidoreductase gamma subunit